jgi:hypothetical protein
MAENIPIQILRGTRAALTTYGNLAAGKLYLATDENRVYVGSGSANYMVGRIEYGTTASRPAFGTSGRAYVSTDENKAWIDDGSQWIPFGAADLSDLTGSLDDIADGTSYQRVAATEVNGSGYVTQINDGANVVTAAQARTHIDDAGKHREINDSGTATTDLWSADKIQTSIDNALDGLDWQNSILDKDLTAPPGGENVGDRYIVGASATGAWSGHDDDIAEVTSTGPTVWSFITPNEGYCARVEDEDIDYVFNGSVWVSKAAGTNHNNLSGLQGGTASEYYHLTSAQHASLTTNLTETIQDSVGSMFNHANHTGLTGTYDDANDRVDLAVSYGGEPGAVSSSTSGTAGSADSASRSDHSHDLGSHAHTGATDGGQIAHSSLSGVGTDDHHAQQHVLTGSDHTASGLTTGHVLTATGATSFAFQALSVGAIPAHASTHQHGGSDEVATATAAANAIPKADGTGKLDDGWIPAIDCGTLP